MRQRSFVFIVMILNAAMVGCANYVPPANAGECDGGGVEVCDGVDNDCNGVIDDACDVDRDGHCASGRTVTSGASCSAADDCSDGNASVHPGHAEICDSLDNDCDGTVDEGCMTPPTCTPSPEVCDDADNDCDGLRDEGCDNDGDGWCNPAMTLVVGAALCMDGGTVGRDCNDGNASVNPGATEVCGNGRDDDCDGQTDEGCATCTPTNGGVERCDGVDNDCDGTADEGGVCTTCTPSAEVCDNADNDCDGTVDEGCDDDGDNYCDVGMTLASGGSSTCPNGGGDCNDGNASVHPGAAELCSDSVDNDCDGTVNEGCTACTPTNGGVEACDLVDNDCDGTVDEGGVCAMCSGPIGSTMVVSPTAALRATCSAGLVTVVYDRYGSPILSAPGATSLTVSVPSDWHGWARISSRCAGSEHDWSGEMLNDDICHAFSVTMDGREICSYARMCDLREPRSGGTWEVSRKPTSPIDCGAASETMSFGCPPV